MNAPPLESIYPWQEDAWERLQAMCEQGRVPHAILFHGPEGIGKSRLALAFACYLLCGDKQGGRACGECHACNLNRAHTHPDLMLLQPEGNSNRILIEQVRTLIEEASVTAHQGVRRIAVFMPAEAMNTHAANALLKILEEPAESTMFLLLSHNPRRLLPTVRSRCQSLALGVPPAEQVLPWLKAQKGAEAQALLSAVGGRPLAARLLAEEGGAEKYANRADAWLRLLEGQQAAVSVAADWSKENLAELLSWMAEWLLDAMRWQASREPGLLRRPGNEDAYKRTGRWLSGERLGFLLEQSLGARRRLDIANPNPRLLLEDFLSTCSAVARRERRIAGNADSPV